jgi:hypothetical protein
LKASFTAEGQGHVFAFYDSLSQDEKGSDSPSLCLSS